MSISVKSILALCVVGFLAACAQQEEVVYVEPVEPEPTMSKY